jgi:hypothetical protein
VLLSKSSSSLSIYHQNRRGPIDKCDELICSLMSYNIQAHLTCLSEHYSKEQNLCTLRLENYNLAAIFSRNNYTGGGVCIFL